MSAALKRFVLCMFHSLKIEPCEVWQRRCPPACLRLHATLRSLAPTLFLSLPLFHCENVVYALCSCIFATVCVTLCACVCVPLIFNELISTLCMCVCKRLCVCGCLFLILCFSTPIVSPTPLLLTMLLTCPACLPACLLCIVTSTSTQVKRVAR